MTTDALFEAVPVPRPPAKRQPAPVKERPPADQHDYADGCAEDNAAHWRDLYEAMSTRYTHVHTLWMREITGQARHDRDVYAAAKRRAWDECLAGVGFYLRPQVTGELDSLVYRLTHLPDGKLSSDDLAFVHGAAHSLKVALDRFDPEPPDSLIAEVRRLRAAVRDQAEQLHLKFGTSNGERCGCPGCEMTRDIDASEAEG